MNYKHIKKHIIMKTKKTNKERDLSIIATGNMATIEKAIREFAFDQESQILLIKTPEYRPILDMYLSIRKLGKQPITFLLSVPSGKYDIELIKAAVVGNVLSEHNQSLLEQNYPELLNDYLSAKQAIEEEQEKEAQKYRKPCSMSMGALFTPELRAKLAM